jgi:hypothetical protein
MRFVSLLSAMAVAAVFSAHRIAADDISFNRDVKPILSQNCFQCHGPDDAHRAAGLRLDNREGATRPAESGATAVRPADPEHSELLVRIRSADPHVRMPPAETGKSLSIDQIDILERWISSGAKYQGHWAFEGPTRPAIPGVSETTRVTNPVDNFIMSRLEKAGLGLSPEADRETLIRRVSLDLTGLPPSPAEWDAFISDTSPAAWEKLIDRLLASPHYGERMAVSWLDSARYADSNGFQSDGSRDIWAWREWVIRAYNANMPFDQFSIEQLAGDMLPNPTRDQIIATGFNRNHRLNGEGGRIEQEWFVETVIDRVETTGLTWLGLTLSCCRCHDHKYDPITQREFYQLFAYFNSVEESGVLSPKGRNSENTPPLLPLMTPELQAQETLLKAAAKIAREHRDTVSAQVSELLAAWEMQVKNRKTPIVWQQIEPRKVESLGGAQFVRKDDGSWLATGPNPGNDEYRIEISLPITRLSGILLEVFPDPTLPSQSLGRGHNGNFVLTGISAEIVSEIAESQPVVFAKAQADYEQPGYTADKIQLGPLSATGRERGRVGWAIDGNDPAKMLPRRIAFIPTVPVDLSQNSVLVLRMRHDSQFPDHNVGRLRIAVSDADIDQVGLGDGRLPADIQGILDLAGDRRTPAQIEQLRRYFREQTDNPIRAAEAALKDAQEKLADFEDTLPTTMVMKEGLKRDAFVLTRGEYDRPADKVERAVPAFLPPLPQGATNDRLGLAQWIVSDSNPLTARVWINRQWERFFGTGIVKTSENFGSQAEFPSHPELLDWLAMEFMQPTVLPSVDGKAARPWDMKALQKLILMSQTYRQRSKVTLDQLRLDPENRLLSRGPRFRLSAELIRDQALAVSGLLVPKIGGPSVRPYMPEGVWDETSKYGDLRGYRHETGEGLYRRTMYTIWKRTAAPPTMLLFDAPNREVCTIQRSRTNTPLQALALLNEVTFVEAARALATRLIKEGGSTPQDRLTYGFRLVTGRRPSVAELEVLVAGFDEDAATYAEFPDAATQLLAVGERPAAADLDTAELAAWTVTANVLLNLDEFVTRE